MADGIPRELTYLILGSRGGENRVKILELLREKPRNINQMASKLGLNYRTITHHVDVMEEHGVLKKMDKDTGYGKLYELDTTNIRLDDLHRVLKRYQEQVDLETATNSMGFINRIIRQTSAGIIVFDRHWNIFFYNIGAKKDFGYADKDLMGVNVESLFDGKIREFLVERLKEKNNLRDIRLQMKTRSRGLKDVSVSVDDIVDDEKRVLGHAMLIGDLSKQKRIEKRMKWTIDRFRFIFNESPSLNLIVTTDGRFLNINKKTRSSLGYNKGELRKGKKKLQDLAEDRTSRNNIEKILKANSSKGAILDMETGIRAGNGEVRRIRFRSVKMIPDISKDRDSIIMVGEDVTERRELESTVSFTKKEKEEIERNLKILGGEIPVGVVFIEPPDGKISYMNTVARDLYGIEETDISIQDHPGRLGLYRTNGEPYPYEELPLSRSLLKGKTIADEELLIRRPDGETRHVKVNSVPVRDNAGNMIRAMGIFWDVTRLRRTEEELSVHRSKLEQQNRELRRSKKNLERSRNEYSDMFDHSPLGLFKLDDFGVIEEVNRTGCKQLEKPRKHLIHSSFSDMVKIEDKDIFRKILNEVQVMGKERRCEVHLQSVENKEKKVLLTVHLINETSEPFFYLSVMDISEYENGP